MRTAGRSVVVAVALGLAAASCGGGGAGGGDGDFPASGPASTDVVGAGPSSANVRPVQITGAGKVHLFGTLTVPPAANSASVPGVLIVPSAGPGDRDGVTGPTGVPDGLARDLAQSFSNAGAATYRYDRRGTGESKLEADVRLSVDDLVADARAGIDLLAQRKETEGRDLSVVGYDSGGLIALRLAAVDSRVKRVVLISTPGSSLADVHAAQLTAANGPASGEALRATVAGLLATRSLPPLDQLRSELRTLLPPAEAAFLADLYGIDPAIDAAKLKVPVLVVVPKDAAPYSPGRLAAAVPGGVAQVVTAAAANQNLQIEGAAAAVDPSDPALHNNGMAAPVAPSNRDTDTVGRITAFLTAAGAVPR